jgi:hypothetical protein
MCFIASAVRRQCAQSRASDNTSRFYFFLTRLQTLQESVLQTKAQLIIVDSVASLVRKEFDNESFGERNDFLAKEASILKCG